MEEHAIASLKANRKLLRKRSFRNQNLIKGNLTKKAKNKQVLTKAEKRALSEKWAKRSEQKYWQELSYTLLIFCLFFGLALYFSLKLLS